MFLSSEKVFFFFLTFHPEIILDFQFLCVLHPTSLNISILHNHGYGYGSYVTKLLDQEINTGARLLARF